MSDRFLSLTAALDAIMARSLAVSVASFVRGHAAGNYDAGMRDDLIALTVKEAPGHRENMRQQIIAKRRAAGKGVPDDWGLTPDEPLNDLTCVEVEWQAARPRPHDLAHAEVMGVA